MLKNYLSLILLFFVGVIQANNIQISNITLENPNTTEGWVQVEFDLSWENSWRLSAGPSNYDAAWVFIKYRVNSGDWAHAQLATTDFVAAAGSTIDITSDGVGAFIYRDSDGSGFLNLPDLRLRWNYGSIDPNDVIDIQVFAIEMVYVPEGQFSVGGTTGDEVNKFFEGGNSTQSFTITSENALAVANSAGSLYYAADNLNAGDQTGPIPAAFPKGFAAFYSMKYEITQGQWVDFFNTLTPSQKAALDVTGANGKNSDDEVARNTISWADGNTSASTSTPDVALNFYRASWHLSYLDWAGLRPLTELEFEKSCRGPIAPKPGEFAWGNANVANAAYTYINLGGANELISNPQQGVGNMIYSATNGTPSGPKRVGIVAASAQSKNREESGGSYYGIMELSGNVYERVVTVGLPEGRVFNGLHGDGVLDNSGAYNTANWPLEDGTGIGYRGASASNGANFTRVSDRFDGASVISNGNGRLGGRGGRTAE
ncbi:SUMF1/EgtB/PvdO family nonheme iron enzyme [Croceiramulus getboli]|nr:SUMF1/EgtB/PvdO family nonheme iron enzyme [Flavobacteriaceae bacterium YJPT1-3]